LCCLNHHSSCLDPHTLHIFVVEIPIFDDYCPLTSNYPQVPEDPAEDVTCLKGLASAWPNNDPCKKGDDFLGKVEIDQRTGDNMSNIWDVWLPNEASVNREKPAKRM